MKVVRRAPWLATLALTLSLLVPAGAAALSAAPNAAAHPCVAGASCRVIDQPAVPAWLSLANGAPIFTTQSLTGLTADEYGSGSAADPTLYSSGTPYSRAPFAGADVVSSTLVDMNGTDPGNADALVLKADRTLLVLGPQSSGYQQDASVTVPAAGKLIGVVGLPGVSDSFGAHSPSRVLVVTDSGFYIYDWTNGSDPGTGTLTLESGTASAPTTDFPVTSQVQNNNDAYACSGFGIGPCNLSLPSAHSDIVGVYQAPPTKGIVNDAVASFAIAYTGGSGGNDYTVDVLAYESGGLTPEYEFQGNFPDGSPEPLKVSYAISNKLIHLATVSGSNPKMTEWDTTSGPERFDIPDNPTASQPCPQPTDGSLPILRTDTSANSPADDSVGTGVSICAALTNDPEPVQYLLERSDWLKDRTGGPTRTIWSVSTTPSPLALPPGQVKALDVSLDMPCDEFLTGFVAHPTADGFPNVSSDPNYCDNGTGFGAAPNQVDTVHVSDGITFKDWESSPRTAVGVHLQAIATNTAGETSLNMTDVGYRVPSCVVGGVTGNPCDNNTTTTDTTNQLTSLPTSTGTNTLTMLPLDPTAIQVDEQLLTDVHGNVLTVPGSANPMPVAVMAAPPYYAGAQQQVTSTSTTFSNSTCNSGGSSQSNTVGVFGGVDVDWGTGGKYEIEALVKLEGSWTTSTELENCTHFDQSFTAGNFGNNFVADNSLLFRVDSGTDTYGNITHSSLGIGVTSNCDGNHLANCEAVFNPSGSQYVLQTLAQLKHPLPNNVFAGEDKLLEQQYGPSLDATLPKPGNPSSYPPDTGTPPVGAHACASAPHGTDSGNADVVDVNPFVPPTVPPAPNVLQAPTPTEVSPASGGNEAGTTSTLSFDSTKTTTSSASFSLGVEGSVKIVYAKFGASYSHAWGTDQSESFQDGTAFSGGVNDFQGFYNPYAYRLFECRSQLQTAGAFNPTGNANIGVPVFLVNYTTQQSTDKLPLNFATPSLLTGTVGQDYAGQIFASGGVPNYSYAISTGSLPPGLTLDAATGQIAGTPTQAGTYNFKVTASDNVGNRALQSASITINPALAINAALAPGDVGVPYSQSLGATGGVPGYSFVLTSEGQVPPGLGIDNSTGTIEGTPTASGTYCFGVFVADSNSPTPSSIDGQTCVTIAPASVSVSLSPSSYTGEVGVPFSATLCCASGGTTPYVWSTPTLPGGLSLDSSSAQITGTPTDAGDFPGLPITVTDSAAGTSSDALSIHILGQLTNGTSSLPNGNVGNAYSAQIAASGGDGSYTFTVTGGALPPGVALNTSTGAITGSPNAGDDAGSPYHPKIAVTDGHGGSVERTYTINVGQHLAPSAPGITSANSVRFLTGQSNTFTVAATGTPAPAISESGALPSGVTLVDNHDGTATLSGTPSAGSVGDHPLTLTADNGVGVAATQPFTLTVDTAPHVTTDPSDQSVVSGNDATFSAAGAGTPATTVQWQVSTNGGSTFTDISGSTSTTLTIHPATLADNGKRYRAVFTNRDGSARSQAALLTVSEAANVTTQPADQTIVPGSTATFTAAASGNPTPTVQWQQTTDNGTVWTNIVGATSSTLTLNNVPNKDDGNQYRAVFSNTVTSTLHSATTSAATLNVDLLPTVHTQPIDLTVTAGTGASFTAAGDGKPTPTVHWQLSIDQGSTWDDIPGATSPTLTLDNVPPSDDANEYRAVFTNPAGSTASAGATLTVRTAPVITQPPSDQTTTAGGNATFTAAANGKPAPSAQWQVSSDHGTTWTDISGATSPAMTLVGLVPNADGNRYRVRFQNSAGAVTSDAGRLTVQSAPSLGTPLVPTTVGSSGSTVTFVTTVTGTPAPTIIWEVSTDGGKTWTPIPGATAPSLTLTNVSPGQNGFLYRAVVTNSQGTTTSGSTRLTVVTPPPSPLLACSAKRLELIDVIRQGRHISITGVARPGLVGRHVTIRRMPAGVTVATAIIHADGSFAALAPLPRRQLLRSQFTRYQAFGADRSSDALKLVRRLHLTIAKQIGSTVHITGTLSGRFPRGTQVLIRERTTCTTSAVVARAKVTRKRRWSAIVPAPTGAASAVALFQAYATVFGGRHLQPTYSLPRPVTTG